MVTVKSSVIVDRVMAQRSREEMIREFLASPPFRMRNVPEEDIGMFCTSLTHDSYSNEECTRGNTAISNERLEFLGDAVMELIVCEHMFRNTEASEGDMTVLKNEVVCNANISRRVKDTMDLDDLLLVGEGHKRNGRNIIEDRMRASAFEAVLGAVYLLYGTDEAKRIVEEMFLGNGYDVPAARSMTI
jgi:ribonuclease-3